jgi:hypothetical protein
MTFRRSSQRIPRTLEIRQLAVPPEAVPAVQEFYQLVERDERSVILLKRRGRTPAP